MGTLTVVGTQWGDEGKGKLTDYFASQATAIVRWAGGDNAGHTIKFDNHKFSLSIVPSGIFHSSSINVIAAGCVVNLKTLCNEINMLEKRGFNTGNLKISARAHLVFPYHLVLDRAFEEALGEDAIGTTKKGIGPCYQDRVKRCGIQIGELFYEDLFQKKLKANLDYANQTLVNIYSKEPLVYEDVYEETMGYFNLIKDKVINAAALLHDVISQSDSKVLFEGAQGIMLDLTFGTYPFVTSSHPSPSSIPIDVGIPPNKVVNALGVVKAYTSRVGNGIFPTEITGILAECIREKGNEYGTVTKRPRRIGWLDTVALKHAITISGINQLAITLLDVLTGVAEIKIAVGYKINDKITQQLPAIPTEYDGCQVEYITMPGWSEDISHTSDYESLPQNARNYLKKIEEILQVKVAIVSVGADRKQTIVLKDVMWG